MCIAARRLFAKYRGKITWAGDAVIGRRHAMSYRAPVEEFRFIFDHVADLARVTRTDRFADATADVTEAILIEAGKLCEDKLAPLQRAGDLHPARLENGKVRTSPGYAEAYGAIAEGGWVSIAASPDLAGWACRWRSPRR
jgi:acyl-CoA dehydrogenase